MTKKTKVTTPKYVTEERNTYEFLNSLKKVIWTAFVVGLISTLGYLIEGGLPLLAERYPEYAVWVLAGTAFLVGVVDYLVHYKDSILVEINTTTGEERMIC